MAARTARLAGRCKRRLTIVELSASSQGEAEPSCEELLHVTIGVIAMPGQRHFPAACWKAWSYTRSTLAAVQLTLLSFLETGNLMSTLVGLQLSRESESEKCA